MLDIRLKMIATIYLQILLLGVLATAQEANIKRVSVSCRPKFMEVSVILGSPFTGVLYPKGLYTNSSCLSEFHESEYNISYTLPLDSCNTMSTDTPDGVEYYNVMVVQPHIQVVTASNKDYDVRCFYKPQITTGNNSSIGVTPQSMTQKLPRASMHIYQGDGTSDMVAENVRIGDDLTMRVSIDKQENYGMKVTDCVVKDGLNWAEQNLINDHGCPIETDIMGDLNYLNDGSAAFVRFKAHKFPYTSSVYYRCNIQLCEISSGQCEDVPPLCSSDGRNLRRKRSSEVDGEGSLITANTKELSQPVTSALHVSDSELTDTSLEVEPPANEDREDAFCLSLTALAIGLAIAGVVLIVGVILLVLFLVQKRRRRKGPSTTAGSSIYSGPYSHQAYSS